MVQTHWLLDGLIDRLWTSWLWRIGHAQSMTSSSTRPQRQSQPTTLITQFEPTEHPSLGSKKPGLDWRVSLVVSDAKECNAAAVALWIQVPSLPEMSWSIWQESHWTSPVRVGCQEWGVSGDQASRIHKTLSKLETFAFENPKEIYSLAFGSLVP